MGRKVEFLRRHPGVVVVVAVVALAALGARYRSTGEGPGATSEVAGSAVAVEEGAGDRSDGSDADDQGGAGNSSGGGSAGDDESTSTSGEGPDDGASGQGGAGTEGGGTHQAAEDATGETTAADVPPDVAHPRPVVDLNRVPDGSDVAEVARWSAGVYTAYAGAEPGEELAGRLEERTTAELYAELASLPPPASYGQPVVIEGVSAGGPFVLEQQDPGTERAVRVSVETPGALVVYEVALHETADGWLVTDLEAL